MFFRRHTGLIVMAVLSVLVVLLARRVGHLEDELSFAHSELDRFRADVTEVGLVAPHFALETAAGRSIDLSSPGAPSALFFFSTSCPSCAEDAVWWSDLAQEFEAAGVRFLAVSVDGLGPDVVAFARDRGIDFPVVDGSDPALSDAYRVEFLPKRVVVGLDGTIVHADAQDDPVGPDGESFLRERLEALLSAA